MWDGRHYKCLGCGEVYSDCYVTCPSCHSPCTVVEASLDQPNVDSGRQTESLRPESTVAVREHDYYEFRELVGERQMSLALSYALPVYYIDGVVYCDVSRHSDECLPSLELQVLQRGMRFITKEDIRLGFAERLKRDGAIFWDPAFPDANPTQISSAGSVGGRYDRLKFGFATDQDASVTKKAIKLQMPLFLFSNVIYADVSLSGEKSLMEAMRIGMRVVTSKDCGAGIPVELKKLGAMYWNPLNPNIDYFPQPKTVAGPVRPLQLKHCNLKYGIEGWGAAQEFAISKSLQCYSIGVWHYVDLSDADDMCKLAETAVGCGLRYITKRDVINGFVDRLKSDGAICWDGGSPNVAAVTTGGVPESGLWHYQDFVPVGVSQAQACLAIRAMSPLYVLPDVVWIELSDDDRYEFDRYKAEAVKLRMRVLSPDNIREGALSGLKSCGAKMWDPREPNTTVVDFSINGNLKINTPVRRRPVVGIETNVGSFELELFEDRAPISVANYLRYVKDHFYDGTIFHRVIDGFMIQGGGYDEGLSIRRTNAPIVNESYNGLRNRRGTVSMARMEDANSGTSQFFINLDDNQFLDAQSSSNEGCGYAVFGKVIGGMDVVEKIAKSETRTIGDFEDVPVSPVVITRVQELNQATCDSERSIS